MYIDERSKMDINGVPHKALEQQFTVVVWEQRGAGKSYYKFDGPVTIDVFLNDIILIEGRYDYHVSSALAKEYFDRIETEKQFYWFEKSCHFPQWSESERFNKLLCDLPV